MADDDHYDADGIRHRRDEVLERWRKLKEALLANRERLGEAQSLQQFSRDVDEMEIWITEKLQTATDESYKDPSNIQVRAAECWFLCVHFETYFANTCGDRWHSQMLPWLLIL